MKTSESINEIAAALAKAQAKIKHALKAAENPGFKRGNKVSTYADLAAVYDAHRPAFAENGLAVVQGSEADGPKVSVETMIVHSSGQWMASTLTVVAAQATPQAIGGAVTYARRYGLAAMVGVAPEDDDGETAEGRPETGAGRRDDGRAAADKMRERVKDPVARLAAVVKWCRDHKRSRAELGRVVGRIIPDGEPLDYKEPEIVKAEQWIALEDAKGGQAGHA
jgi:hypothetical protein